MYSQEIADQICARLRKGETLREICKTEGMPDNSTVVHWANGEKGAPESFGQQYARARRDGYDARAEQLIELIESVDYTASWGNAAVQAAKLRIDTEKWLLSKMRPDKYGDSLALKGDKEHPLKIEVTGLDLGKS